MNAIVIRMPPEEQVEIIKLVEKTESELKEIFPEVPIIKIPMQVGIEFVR